jgi:hypothetical protein
MISANGSAARAIQLDFPDGFPYARLDPLFDPLFTEDSERGTLFRRAATRDDPLLFALAYCRNQITTRKDDHDLVAFSEYHLDFIAAARRWPRGQPSRDAWVAPRQSGKSTWPCLILPLWALAHGYRRFVLMLSVGDKAVYRHRERMYAQLEGNERLLADFPDLKVSKSGPDRITQTGAMVMARSINSQVQGAVSPSGDRPDLIVLDDIENEESSYSNDARDKRLRTMRDNILALNETATVVLVGTTTMYGSIMHDVVQAARGEKVERWITESEFRPHYYPAIMDEGTPRERSLWPGRWTVSWLRYKREQDPAYFAKNYANRPETAGGVHWTKDLFYEDDFFVSKAFVLVVDTAASDNESADDFGFAIIGSDDHPDPARRRMCVEYSWKGHLKPTELLEKIYFWKGENPQLKTVVLESIGTGGTKWRDTILVPWPDDLELILANPSKRGSKKHRLLALLREYERRAIVHRRYFSDLRGQMLSWPKTKDDLMDAVATGVEYFRGQPMN